MVISINELRKEKAYERIVQWKEYADREEDTIKRFIFRWVAFNGLYSALYSKEYGQEKTENAKDMEKLNYFLNNFILTNEIPASEIYSDAIIKLFKEKIKSDRRGMGDLLKNLEGKKNKEELVRNMIMIVYKIRCRLFHGEKNPNLDVNEEVIDPADKLIKFLLNHVIKEK